jgi:hypothetical protein
MPAGAACAKDCARHTTSADTPHEIRWLLGIFPSTSWNQTRQISPAKFVRFQKSSRKTGVEQLTAGRNYWELDVIPKKVRFTYVSGAL